MYCFIFGCSITGLHILSLSLDFGTFLPSLLDGEWAAAYTNQIVQPIEAFLHNQTMSRIVLIVMWGLLGFAVFSLLEYIVELVRDVRDSEHNIRVVEQAVITHPMRQGVLLRMLWRMVIAMIFIALLVLAQPLFKKLLAVDYQLFVSEPTMHIILQIGGAILIWSFCAHVALVLIRLYLFRTRLGNDLLF